MAASYDTVHLGVSSEPLRLGSREESSGSVISQQLNSNPLFFFFFLGPCPWFCLYNFGLSTSWSRLSSEGGMDEAPHDGPETCLLPKAGLPESVSRKLRELTLQVCGYLMQSACLSP